MHNKSTEELYSSAYANAANDNDVAASGSAPFTIKKVVLFRQIVIFLLLLGSFFLISYDNNEKDQDEYKVIKSNVVSLSDILFDYNIGSNNVNNKLPDDVIKFINSYVFESGEKKDNSSKVVIYEIIDDVNNNKKIDVFLKEAEKLLLADKLTIPKGNNAFERYEMVLGLDPSNKEALSGINKIIDRYVALIEDVISKKETYKVAALIKGAYKVGKDYRDMAPIIEKYSSYIDDKTMFSTIPAKRVIRKEPGNDAVEQILNSEKPVPSIDHDIFLAAKLLVEENNISGAITVLKQFTIFSDYWGESYDMLLDLYLGKDKLSDAKKLVASNPTLDTFELAEKVARMFIADGDEIGALKLLDSHNPNIQKYRNYYAIKAGLYYKQGRYREAINLYRQLIAKDYKNSRYWLGLAVSLDAINDKMSLEAYGYAEKYASQNSDVKDYLDYHISQIENK